MAEIHEADTAANYVQVACEECGRFDCEHRRISVTVTTATSDDTPADAPVSRGALPKEIAEAIDLVICETRNLRVATMRYGFEGSEWAEAHSYFIAARDNLESLILKHIQGEK